MFRIRFFSLQLAAIALFASFAFPQQPTPSPTPTPMATPPTEPVYKEYRGVSIGMGVAEARAALGTARSKGPRQDFYVFSEKETAQVFYRDGKVSALSVDYVGSDSGAPSPMEVLGIEIKPKKNGSMYRLIRYPSAGYWISYNRTAQKNPTISITMRKLAVVR